MMKSDAQLRQEIRDEIDWDPSIDARQIGVEVNQSVAMLTGHVNSFAEKHAAERAAERIAGVKAVANEIDVKLPISHVRADADIAKAAVDALAWHTNVPDERIKINVDNGWVTLSGQVDWAYQRAAAERAVRYLKGVNGVSNMVTLKSYVAPSDLQQKIHAAFERRAHREARQIVVSVNEGTVTLSGKVQSAAEREAAKGVAWGSPGVTAVIDHLVLE